MKTPSPKTQSAAEIARERMRMLRNRYNMSQENMAVRITIGPSSYSKLEEGTTKLSVDVLEKIANAFDVDIHFMLGWDNVPDHSNQADKIVIDTLTLRIEEQDKKIREYEKEIQELRERIERLAS